MCAYFILYVDMIRVFLYDANNEQTRKLTLKRYCANFYICFRFSVGLLFRITLTWIYIFPQSALS